MVKFSVYLNRHVFIMRRLLSYYGVYHFSFGPWSWFTSKVDFLVDECHLDTDVCEGLLQVGETSTQMPRTTLLPTTAPWLTSISWLISPSTKSSEFQTTSEPESENNTTAISSPGDTENVVQIMHEMMKVEVYSCN